MTPTLVLILVLLIGVVSGLRSLTAPAAVAWGAHLGWLHLAGTRLAFMSSVAAVAVLSLLAIVELITDKLPATPSRTAPVGLIARIVLGGFSGGVLYYTGSNQGFWLGAVVGVIGALIGTYGGYQVRTRSVKALHVPDFVIALIEDAIAVGGAFCIVSRF